MYRCLELASRGAGMVTPNPMVGAILVCNDKIIGEGWHKKFGQAHAEVNCIKAAIIAGHEELFSSSTMYVSLEPCAHFGKTPPCTDLIIRYQIPKVVIGCRDPFPDVNGKGIEKLRKEGIEVVEGMLEKECLEINRRFFTFHQQHRPYVILKWAETADGFISGGREKKERLLISNEFTNRLVHKWRSEEAAILVGTNTAMHDDPQLTNRFWPGNSPVRLIVDMELKLPSTLHVFDKKEKTIVFNTRIHSPEEDWDNEQLLYYQVTNDVSLVHQILNALYQLKIQSILVEGGANLLQQFIDENAWDEVRRISNGQSRLLSGAIGKGLKAPVLSSEFTSPKLNVGSDTIENIFRQSVY